jgi:hypothetical protein
VAGFRSPALQHVLDASLDREAAALVRAQVKQLDREVLKSLSGLIGALDKFQSEIVNAYDPDIVFEAVLQTNGLIYVQLPANLFRIQAAALGKVILMDVQQEGSLRQVFRTSRNQRPFAVTVDEFYNLRRKEGPLLTSLATETRHRRWSRLNGCIQTPSRPSRGADRGTCSRMPGSRPWRTGCCRRLPRTTRCRGRSSGGQGG